MTNPRTLSQTELIELMHKHADKLHMTKRERTWAEIEITSHISLYRNYLINNFAPLLYGKFPI